MTDALRPKQRAFVVAYTGAARGNATEAARLAGYRGNTVTLASVGAENLQKPQIRRAIAEAERETRSRAIADRREIQELLSAFGRGLVQEPHVLQSGAVVQTEPSVASRTQALMSLAKMRGYLIDKVEVKTADQLRAQLEQLQKRMPPDAYRALLEALA